MTGQSDWEQGEVGILPREGGLSEGRVFKRGSGGVKPRRATTSAKALW